MIEEKKQDLVAAMDLGTNCNRLLIADKNGKAVYRDVYHVALGEGLAENGCFSSVAMERAICSFMDFSEMMKAYGVQKYRAIATAACRMSSNTKEFFEEVKKVSGVELEVISEFEEARLTLLGAKLNAPKNKKYLFVYDLGGGSTEVTLATNTNCPEILATVSVPLGGRNATEIFDLRGYNAFWAERLNADVKRYLRPFLRDYNAFGAERLETDVKRYLRPFFEQIKNFDYQGNTALIATSSTPLRLASWLSAHEKYDKFAADGVCVSIADLDTLIDKVLLMKESERSLSPYIGRNRASIFVAALIIFKTIYQSLGCAELTASLKGAQEAIVAELAKEI